MNFIKNKRGGAVFSILLIAIVLLFSSSQAFAEALLTQSYIDDGGIPPVGTIKFISYYTGDDLKIQTEDSQNDTNNNAGYVSGNGTCTTQPGQLVGDQTGSSFTIEVTRTDNGRWGKGIIAGLPGAGVANTTPGTPGSKIILGNTNYVSMPQNITAYKANGKVLLVWNAPATGTATGYRAYRRPSATEQPTEIVFDRRGIPATTYLEDAAANGTTEAYIACAYNATGFGPHTDEIIITADASASDPSIGTAPSSGSVGDPITITGNNFGAGGGTLIFNGTSEAIPGGANWNNTTINGVIPSGAQTGKMYVITSGGRFSNGWDYTIVAAAPVISSHNPISGVSGTRVTIVGSNFGATQGGSTVSFNLVNSTTITGWSDTLITADAPAGGTTGNIVVTVGGQSSTGTHTFTYNTPDATLVAPNQGNVGDTGIVITGTNFGTVPGGSRSSAVNHVALAGVQLSDGQVTAWTNTSITITVPSITLAGLYNNLTVTAGGNNDATPLSFTVTPEITSVSSSTNPNYYIGNSVITINGSAFGPTPGTVTVGGVALTGVTWGATQITGTLPQTIAAGPNPVVVTAGGQLSNSYSITCQPYITQLLPNSGGVGDWFIVNGYAFGATPSTVTLNGVTATTRNWGAGGTSFEAQVPSTTSGPVVVTVNTQPSNGVAFTIGTNPVISSLNPSTGVTGTRVTIVGNNFTSAPTVTFNGVAASVIGWTTTIVTADAPVGGTTGPVIVTIAGNPSIGVTFTYLVPDATSVAPNQGNVGDTGIVITGTNFGTVPGGSRSSAVNHVSLAGVQLSDGQVTAWTNTSITITVPSVTVAGLYNNLTVTAGGNNDTTPLSFTVTPEITSVSSSTNPNYYIGNSVITINGSAFGPTPGTVTVGGVALTGVTWGATQITGTLPQTISAGSNNVAVTAGGQPSNLYPITCQPYITGTSTTEGVVGVPVTINGYGFGSPQGSSTVTFNGTAATCAPWGNLSIGCTVPTGATTGNLIVTVNGQPSNPIAFTVPGTVPPVIGGPNLFVSDGGPMVAYPNPFNPNDKNHPLRMLIGAATGEAVDVYVFDSSGRVVWMYKGPLAANREVQWEGETSYGEVVENGIYLTRAFKGSSRLSRGKILVIKK